MGRDGNKTKGSYKPGLSGIGFWFGEQWRIYKQILIPVYVFSFLSFLTTAAGVKLLIPAGPFQLPISLLGSLAIQAILLACAFNLYSSGLRSRYTAIYIIPALVSMMFSYIGLFKQFSGGFINQEQRTNFEEQYEDYVADVERAISSALSVVQNAVSSAELLADHEKNRGYTHSVPATRYLQKHQERSGIDFKQYPQGSGEGPIYIFWKQIIAQERRKAEYLEGLAALAREHKREGVTDWDISQKVDFVGGLSRIDWQLLKEIHELDEQPFTQPVTPRVVIIGYDSGAEISISEKKWAIESLRAIRSSWDPATIGVPLGFAISLDLVVFIIPVLFRRGRGRFSQEDIRAIVISADINAGDLSTRAMRAIFNCIQKRSWIWCLDFREIEGLEPAAQAVLEQLERKGAIRPRRVGRAYRIPKAVYEYLESVCSTEA